MRASMILSIPRIFSAFRIQTFFPTNIQSEGNSFPPQTLNTFLPLNPFDLPTPQNTKTRYFSLTRRMTGSFRSALARNSNIIGKKLKKPNEPVDLIPVPSGLSAHLLLIPLRGQEECRKQAGIGHWGRSTTNMNLGFEPSAEEVTLRDAQDKRFSCITQEKTTTKQTKYQICYIS